MTNEVYTVPAGRGQCSPTLRWKEAKEGAPQVMGWVKSGAPGDECTVTTFPSSLRRA